MEQCVALVDYEALTPDEISFRRGDVINVTAKGSASGFWEGYVASAPNRPLSNNRSSSSGRSRKKNSVSDADVDDEDGDGSPRIGSFANCFVSSNLRNLVTSTFRDKAICLFNYTAAIPGSNAAAAVPEEVEMSFHRGDVLTVVGPGPSPGWWRGVNETARDRIRRGKAASPQSTARLCGTLERPLLFPSNFVSCNIVQAVFSFEGRQSHELSCRVGDVILVHRRWNDGWWEGSLGGQRGIFPSNYTVPNISSTRPPFFCQACKTIFDDSQTASLALFYKDTPSDRKSAEGGGRRGRGAGHEDPPATVGGAALASASASVSAAAADDGGGGDGDGSGADSAAIHANVWRSCSTCARNAAVTDCMMRALTAFDAGEMEELDLFAFVQTSIEDERHKGVTMRSDAEAWAEPALFDAKDVADLSEGRVKF